MRNIKSNQTSKSSVGWKVFVGCVSALLAAGAIYTVLNVMSHSGEAVVAPTDDQASVAVVSGDILAGDTLEGNYTFVNRDIDELPSDAIQQGYDFAGAVSAINAMPNTILTEGMLLHPDLDESSDDTSRYVSVNYVALDSGVTEGDFVDIRLRKYGTEEGFAYSDDVVLAKKKVHAIAGKTVTLSLSEEEQLALNIAAVDASSYGRESSENALLYCTRYVNASQEKAVVTYSNAKLSELIDSNPNIIAEAQRELASKQTEEVPQETEIIDNSAVSAEN